MTSRNKHEPMQWPVAAAPRFACKSGLHQKATLIRADTICALTRWPIS